VDWFRFWLKGEEDPDPAKAGQYTRWRKMRDQQIAASHAREAEISSGSLELLIGQFVIPSGFAEPKKRAPSGVEGEDSGSLWTMGKNPDHSFRFGMTSTAK